MTPPTVEADAYELTPAALDDLRWFATEAVAQAVCTGRDDIDGEGHTRIIRCACALGAVGGEINLPTPGTEFEADRIPWPLDVSVEDLRVLSEIADEVADLSRMAAGAGGNGDAYGEAASAMWHPRVERVRRTRSLIDVRLSLADRMEEAS